MDDKTDPMGGSLLKISIVFYTRWNDMWETKLTPWRADIQHAHCFLHALERHMGNKTGPMGGLIFNMCLVFYTTFNIRIAFYTHWNDVWVTTLPSWEGQYSTFALLSTRTGTTYE